MILVPVTLPLPVCFSTDRKCKPALNDVMVSVVVSQLLHEASQTLSSSNDGGICSVSL